MLDCKFMLLLSVLLYLGLAHVLAAQVGSAHLLKPLPCSWCCVGT